MGIYSEGGVDSILDDMNKDDIISEISYILDLPNRQLNGTERTEAETKIDKILKTTKSEALKLQLNTIKSRMY